MKDQVTEQQRTIYTQLRQIFFSEHGIKEKHAVVYFSALAFQQSLQKE